MTTTQQAKRSNAARKAHVTRRINWPAERFLTYQARQDELARDNLDREFHRLVLWLGGVNDPTYETLPRWCRRRAGRPLDELVDPLREAGYPVECANDLHRLLEKRPA